MHRFAHGLALFIALVAPSLAKGCTIPVFRYAFERWDAGKFDLIVYHRGPLMASQSSLVRNLERHGHLTITTVDLDGKVGKNHAALWKMEEKSATLPWLMVRSEEKTSKEPSSWSGPLNTDNVKGLLDSPLRQRIVSHFCNGDSAAFVLLLSGNSAKDEAARKLLNTQLPRLEKLIKLSEVSKDGPQLKLPLPLRVSLPILELKRDQADEQVFVQMLLASEEDLDLEQGPIVFPIFGRGRLIGALYGMYLDSDTIFETVKFLCGDCSCQVKNLNPGIDLLFTADWDGRFEQIINAKPATTKPAEPTPKKEERTPNSEKPAPQEPTTPAKIGEPSSPSAPAAPLLETRIVEVAAPGRTRMVLWIGAGGAGAMALAAGVWISRTRSKS